MSIRHSAPSRNRGVTLVELLVGLTIGLLLVLIASGIYLYSKKSYNAVSENSQMEENGRFALDLLAKYIQSSGFAMIDPAGPGPTMPLEDKLAGCEFGYVNASAPTAISDLACRTATPSGERKSASIYTRHETDQFNASGGKYQGFDCTSSAAASKLVDGVQTYEVRSYFFISQVVAETPYGAKSMGQLSCVSDVTTNLGGVSGALTLVPQPLVPGIEQLAVKYITTAGRSVPIPTTPAGWKDIAAMELCVLARNIQSAGNDTGTTYKDCYDADITAGAGESFRALRSTVALRNTASL